MFTFSTSVVGAGGGVWIGLSFSTIQRLQGTFFSRPFAQGELQFDMKRYISLSPAKMHLSGLFVSCYYAPHSLLLSCSLSLSLSVVAPRSIWTMTSKGITMTGMFATKMCSSSFYDLVCVFVGVGVNCRWSQEVTSILCSVIGNEWKSQKTPGLGI